MNDEFDDYAYKDWERQRDVEPNEEAKRYAEIDSFIEDFFLEKWNGAEPTKLWNKRDGRYEWVWSEKPSRRIKVALPQHVKADTKVVPNTLREMMEGHHES